MQDWHGGNNRYNFTYNGMSCNRYGLFLIDRPNIETGEEDIEQVKVLGKNGYMYISRGTIKDKPLTLRIGFYDEPQNWFKKYRAIKQLFKTEKPLGKPFNYIQFSDDTRYLYEVKYFKIETTEREACDLGYANVSFQLNGLTLYDSGLTKREFTYNTIYNKNCDRWLPVIEFSYDVWAGGDDRTTITIKGGTVDKTFTGETLNELYSLSFVLNEGEYAYIDLNRDIFNISDIEGNVTSGFNRLEGDFSVLTGNLAILYSYTGNIRLKGTIQECNGDL